MSKPTAWIRWVTLADGTRSIGGVYFPSVSWQMEDMRITRESEAVDWITFQPLFAEPTYSDSVANPAAPPLVLSEPVAYAIQFPAQHRPSGWAYWPVSRETTNYAVSHDEAVEIIKANPSHRMVPLFAEGREDLILGSIANAMGMEDYAGLESVMAHARQMRKALKGVIDHPGCGEFYCNACPCMDAVIRVAKLGRE